MVRRPKFLALLRVALVNEVVDYADTTASPSKISICAYLSHSSIACLISTLALSISVSKRSILAINIRFEDDLLARKDVATNIDYISPTRHVKRTRHPGAG